MFLIVLLAETRALSYTQPLISVVPSYATNKIAVSSYAIPLPLELRTQKAGIMHNSLGKGFKCGKLDYILCFSFHAVF